MEALEFYLVRNKEGKYLRSRGYHGYGECWVAELKYAKVYTRKGTALSQITYWASTFPDYGVPELIPLTATPGEPIPQEERVLKSQAKKLLSKHKTELWRLQMEVKGLQSRVDKLSGRHPILDQLLIAREKISQIETKINELSK
jgi:hypothetical protein